MCKSAHSRNTAHAHNPGLFVCANTPTSIGSIFAENGVAKRNTDRLSSANTSVSIISLKMVLGINPLSILFCTCGTITGNAKKKMSNPQYYTIYLIWMIICLVFEYIPSEPVRGVKTALML